MVKDFAMDDLLKRITSNAAYLESEDIKACLKYAALKLDHPVIVAN
ncbi:MAG: hypothetical protein IPG01_17920 [Chitinophagaceae bacterium]|nr:hypothetical protein [Chitinophagaceae bacterium]